MYILGNALRNLIRNKGRNILMAAIIFAIIATTVVALIINNTSDAVIASYSERFASEVSITPDMQKLREEALAAAGSAEGRLQMIRPEISPELMLEFTKSEALRESVAYASLGANSDEIIAIDQAEETETQAETGGRLPDMAIFGSTSAGNFKVQGDYWQDFIDGNRALDDDGISAMPAMDGECLVSGDLAEANAIAVGDILAFSSVFTIPIPGDMDTENFADGVIVEINETEYTLSVRQDGMFTASRSVDYDLKVTGIYIDLTDEYSNSFTQGNSSQNRRNEILTTLGTLLDLRKADETGINLSVTYYLKNPDFLGQFEAEVRAMGLDDIFLVSTDSASYEKIVRPVEGLKSISITFMIVVIILGASILLLLSSISIRERKYEIGVLRAMGMKKSKVALGLWTEILVITAICLILGIGAGVAAAQPITDSLLQVQIEAEQDDASGQAVFQGAGSGAGQGGGRFGGIIRNPESSANVQPLSEMKVTVGLDTILEIVLIAFGLASAAGLFSISKITKYEPIKILMERN
ncbi:MAG: ABC transporter permease [Clostridia bacterium]|nr:ABC transporter permease [Clostridia bacterium]